MTIVQEVTNAEHVPFYENDYFEHNLAKGTLFNRSGTKMCMMPSELLLGLQKALEDETGPAWRMILKRCGEIWGRRVAKRFQKELTDFYGRPLHDLPMREFAQLVESHFRYHGWGNLKLEFSHAEAGLITARMENSAFVEVVGASEYPVDGLVSGLLSQLIAEGSERDDIECYETQCSAQGAPYCRFIVGIGGRLSKLDEWVEEGLEHEEIMTRLAKSKGSA